MQYGKKLLSLCLIMIMVLGMMPVTAIASGNDQVYISVSYDGTYINACSGDPLVYMPVSFEDLAAIDLDSYGLGEYLYDEDGDGTAEITALHMVIYAHENLYGGDWSEVTFSGAPGSSYFEGGIFGFDENLNYFLNGEYPLAGAGWGATSDQIVLKPGDFLDIASFSSWDFFADSNYGFHFFVDENEDLTHDYVAQAGTELQVKLVRSYSGMGSGAAIYEEAGYQVSYGLAYGEAEGTVTTDDGGCATIVFPEAGTWHVWCDGGYGLEYPDSIISAPGYAVVKVTAEEEQEPAVETFAIPGCAPNLESELEMGIAVPKAALPEGIEFTAVVKQISGGEVVKTFNVPQTEWKNYNANLHMVYVKLAAKCMADDFAIEVIDADGNVWNEPYQMSYRTYVANNYASADAAKKTLFVDMLNYGAAAQQRFNYNVDDLANSQLTEEQQAMSLAETVSLTNKQVMGTKNIGSTVSLESRILVYSVFKNMEDVENMYAEVVYTDARGNEKTVTIPGSKFELYNASLKAYKICVDTLVPADVDCVYTMTVYNADGTVFDTATEGLGSYLTRNIAKDTVFGATINFGMAAKQYFVG